MDTNKLNKWLTLAANFGVIAGILFLVLELRQNSELMRAQSRTEMSQDVIGLLTMNVNDAAYVDTIFRGLNGEELTDIEQEQFYRTQAAWMWHWNNLAYLHKVGLYDTSEFDLQIRHILADMNALPGLKKHWCDQNEWTASPALIEAMNGAADGELCAK